MFQKKEKPESHTICDFPVIVKTILYPSSDMAVDGARTAAPLNPTFKG
ncbi:MAG: hypothetical protein IJC21_04545 [Lentisphaeria bacterium]|nr:hypothetical protein [Lentisphaeria bacterium]